jgi:hypothetical protein
MMKRQIPERQKSERGGCAGSRSFFPVAAVRAPFLKKEDRGAEE